MNTLTKGPVAAMFALWLTVGIGNASPVGFAAKPAKPLLLFEIDEGFSDGLLGAFRSDPKGLDECLGRIRTGLAPLAVKYDVAVLVYPCQAYSPAAPNGGLDSVQPALRRLLDFFGKRSAGEPHIDVFLEAYSSGVATEQSGELDKRPIPLLGAGPSDHPRLGLSMDMQTFGALSDAYPDVLKGIRFHEVYGSDAGWRAQPTWKHGFITDEQVIRGCIELCRRKRLRLLWSDSNWLMKSPPVTDEPHYVYDPNHRPYFEAEPYRTLQNEAEQKLGSLLCFSWANNNYHYTPNLEFLTAKIGPSKPGVTRPTPSWLFFDMPYTQFPLKTTPNSQWGMSIQSWFWHELTYTLTGHYYLSGELACPEEIMAAYVKDGLRQGASILQFEPGSFFFNEPMHGKPDFSGAWEQAPDHSERLALKRLRQALLDPGGTANAPDRLDVVFDRNQQRFHENDVSDPPIDYAQTTLGFSWLGQRTKPVHAWFDFYSYGIRWLDQSENRLGDWLFRSPTQAIHRIEIDGDGVDEFLTIEPERDGVRRVTFYNQNCGRLGEDLSIARDTADGTFVGLTTANLIPEIVGQGDPDEIVVARRPANGDSIRLRVYKMTSASADRTSFRYEAVSDDQNRTLIASTINAASLHAKTYVGIEGMRSDARILANGIRSTDRLAVVVRSKTGLAVTTKIDGVDASSPLVSTPQNMTDFLICALDEQLSGRDSLCLAWRNAGSPPHWTAAIYRSHGGLFPLMEQHAINPSATEADPPTLYALRKRILLNAGTTK